MVMLVIPAALICRSSSRRKTSEWAFATLAEIDAVTTIASVLRLARALLDMEVAFINVASLGIGVPFPLMEHQVFRRRSRSRAQ
jgi:hypothetical protein